MTFAKLSHLVFHFQLTKEFLHVPDGVKDSSSEIECSGDEYFSSKESIRGSSTSSEGSDGHMSKDVLKQVKRKMSNPTRKKKQRTDGHMWQGLVF